MRRVLLAALAVVASSIAAAQYRATPLYIVNGVERTSVADIPEEDIENIEVLEANEQTVAKYGERANNGVIVVTLRFDKEATFGNDDSFNSYIASRIKWPSHYPVARFVARFTVEADGSLTLGEELESTDRTLRKRVLAAFKAAPRWQVATKRGVGVASSHLLYVQLPKGADMPRERYIVIR